MSHQICGICWREEENFLITDTKDKLDTWRSPPSKRIEILQRSLHCNDQPTALLPDEGLRAATGDAGEILAADEREPSLTVHGLKSLGATSGAGAVHSAVDFASNFGRDIKGTSIRLALVLPQECQDFAFSALQDV